MMLLKGIGSDNNSTILLSLTRLFGARGFVSMVEKTRIKFTRGA